MLPAQLGPWEHVRTPTLPPAPAPLCVALGLSEWVACKHSEAINGLHALRVAGSKGRSQTVYAACDALGSVLLVYYFVLSEVFSHFYFFSHHELRQLIHTFLLYGGQPNSLLRAGE